MVELISAGLSKIPPEITPVLIMGLYAIYKLAQVRTSGSLHRSEKDADTPDTE